MTPPTVPPEIVAAVEAITNDCACAQCRADPHYGDTAHGKLLALIEQALQAEREHKDTARLDWFSAYMSAANMSAWEAIFPDHYGAVNIRAAIDAARAATEDEG